MNLINYFLENIVIISGLKMKKRLIQQEKVIKKNLQIYTTCMLLLESDEEVKLVPEETISERVKLNPRKNKKDS